MPGYVEPYPAFYAKIAELATTLHQGLTQYGLGDPEMARKLETVIDLAKTLESISEKELAGDELTEEEGATIQEYGHYLESLGQFTDTEEGRTLSPAADKSALVADVHTSTISQLGPGGGDRLSPDPLRGLRSTGQAAAVCRSRLLLLRIHGSPGRAPHRRRLDRDARFRPGTRAAGLDGRVDRGALA